MNDTTVELVTGKRGGLWAWNRDSEAYALPRCGESDNPVDAAAGLWLRDQPNEQEQS